MGQPPLVCEWSLCGAEDYFGQCPNVPDGGIL